MEISGHLWHEVIAGTLRYGAGTALCHGVTSAVLTTTPVSGSTMHSAAFDKDASPVKLSPEKKIRRNTVLGFIGIDLGVTSPGSIV